MNEEYYCNLVNENFKEGLYPNYENIELIKFMLKLKDVSLEYGHLSHLIKVVNLTNLGCILNFIKLDTPHENYLLLKDVIKLGKGEIIKLLMSSFISFKDYGILSELLIDWKVHDKELLEMFLSDERIVKIDMIGYSIECGNVELFKYLTENGYQVNHDLLNKIKNNLLFKNIIKR